MQLQQENVCPKGQADPDNQLPDKCSSNVWQSQGGQTYLTYNKRRKVKWIGYILRTNYLLKYVTEGKINGRIEAKEKQGRRYKQLMDDLKENRG
jgi:hypothetical protein